jgi:hypothetical protein
MLVLERNSRKRQLAFIERSIKIGVQRPQPEWVSFLLAAWEDSCLRQIVQRIVDAYPLLCMSVVDGQLELDF